MKIWTPICLSLLCACSSASSPNDSAESGGSNPESTSQAGSAGKVSAGNKGGAGGKSQSSSSDGEGGSSQAAGSSGDLNGVGGVSGAAGKNGLGGGAGTKGGAGGKTGAGGGKVGSGGSAETDGGKTASGGSTGGNAGKTGSGGSTGTDAGKSGSDGGTPGTGTNHVFLLLGQSNMAGYPKAKDTDKEKNQQIQVLGFDNCPATSRKENQWDVAVPPLHECGVGALGPGDWFSKTIISKYPAGDTIWLVPNAHSGEKISTLSKGGSHWDSIVSRAKQGQQKGPIEGMLFHQGESDCGNAEWPNWVKQMYADLKSALNLTKDVPFLAGELPPDSACSNHTPLVDKLPSVMGSFTYVISAKDLKLDPADTDWHMHFDHDSQVTFGKRYAETMISALGL